jgi:hypothetical protein
MKLRHNLLLFLLVALLVPADLLAQQSVTATINAPREDSTATNGDRGIPLLVKRCDTADQSASANGRYGVLCTNEFGELRVAVEGLDLEGDKTNDNAAPSNDLIPVAGAIASSTAQAYTTGRLVLPRVNLFGSTAIFLTDPTTGSPLTASTDVVEDSVETAGGSGPFVMSVRRDTAASSAGASGDNASFNTDALGSLWTRTLDPCSGVVKSYYVVNISTATTVEIANAAGASQHFYICSVNLVADDAQTVAIGEDDTDGCGSITAGLHGGATAAAGWSFAANGGITLGNGGASVMRTATANRYLCIITGQAAQLSGTITYVAAP